MKTTRTAVGLCSGFLGLLVGLAFFAGPAAGSLTPAGGIGSESADPNPFEQVSDFTFDSAGNAAVLDNSRHRVDVFSAEGDLLRSVTVPDEIDGSADVLQADDGGLEVFDRSEKSLYRFDPSGDPDGSFVLDVPGVVRDFSVDRSGGYVVAYGKELRIARLDLNGTRLVDWPTGRILSGGSPNGAFVELAEHEIDDQVFVASEYLLGMFSRGGEPWANWSLATEECDVTGAGIIDLALDGEGNVYLLAAVSPAEDRTTLFKLDEALSELWREPVDETFTQVAVGPDDSIYLTSGNQRISRYQRTEPATGRWRCEEPVPPREFELLGVKYGPARAWARIRIYLPEGGRIVASGPKLRTKARTVTNGGIHAINVKARSRFNRPARPRRELKLPVLITYRSGSGSAEKRLTVRLRGKLRRTAR